MNINEWKKKKKELKLTHDALAEKSGISRRTIAGIFSGDPQYSSPTLNTIEAIEKALGISDESGWIKEDRESGISEQNKASVTPDELELLELYNTIGHKFGKERQATVIKLLTAMADEEKM